MAFSFTDPADSIANLTISSPGSEKPLINIKDIDGIPDAVNARDCPIMFPDPTDFITNVVWVRESQGSGLVALWTITFNMNYLFLFAPAGGSRGIFDVIPGMVKDIEEIIETIVENDAITGTIDIVPVGIAEFGVVLDPSNEEFLGTTLSFGITQFKN